MNGDRTAGKPETVARPTVAGAPLTEATGKAILVALAELSGQISTAVTSIMDMEQRIRPANSA